MRTDRLLQLAEHLEKGQLGHRRFDFNILHRGFGYRSVVYTCGAVGCAMGELPKAFPGEWAYDDEYDSPRLNGSDGSAGMEAQVAAFFGLVAPEQLATEFPDSSVVDYLFYPGRAAASIRCTRATAREEGYTRIFGAPRLLVTATKDEVAAHIRRFVAHFQEKA